jgi:hypothetical protein
VKMWTELTWSRMLICGGVLSLLDSVRSREFPDQLKDLSTF